MKTLQIILFMRVHLFVALTSYDCRRMLLCNWQNNINRFVSEINPICFENRYMALKLLNSYENEFIIVR